MRVTIVGSHLFLPTHYSIVGLFLEIKVRLKSLEAYAKYPLSHEEFGANKPYPLDLPKNKVWRLDTDIVHAVGGGETAIKVSNLLDERIPMIVSFVGGADLTRQLSNPSLRVGYQRLFSRVTSIIYPDSFGYHRLKDIGAPIEKMICIPAALPLTYYEPSLLQNEMKVIMVGRPIKRKNHGMVIEIAKRSKKPKKLLIVGKKGLSTNFDPRIYQYEFIPHAELVRLLSTCDILLQTGNWKDTEVDSLPTIILEALAMGIPVISTPLVGVKELHDKFPDFIQIAETPAKFAELIDKMLNNNKKGGQIELKEAIYQTYGLNKIANQIISLYTKIVNG